MTNLKITYMDKKLNEGSISVKGKSGIKIKKANKGKFTDYCGGKVTDECIQKGLNSNDPAIRKRANFARNARKWKHCGGGYLHTFKIIPNHVMDSNPNLDNMKRKYEGGGFFSDSTNKQAFVSTLASIGKGIFNIVNNNKQTNKLKNIINDIRNREKIKVGQEAQLEGKNIYDNNIAPILGNLQMQTGDNSVNSSIVGNTLSYRASLPYVRSAEQRIDQKVDELLNQVSQIEQDRQSEISSNFLSDFATNFENLSDVYSKYQAKKKQEKEAMKTKTQISQQTEDKNLVSDFGFADYGFYGYQ